MNFNKPEFVPPNFTYLPVLIDAELNLNSETHKGKQHNDSHLTGVKYHYLSFFTASVQV